MGINSIHSAPEDFIWCENTTNKTKFKCSVIETRLEYTRIVTQLDLRATKIVLVVNGRCDIKVKDYIKVPMYDKILQVQGILPVYDQTLARKRCDYDNFRSSLEVALS